MVAECNSPPLIGVLCSKHKANRPLRRKHLKYFAVPIGDLSTDSLGDTALDEKKHKTWFRNSSRVCSNIKIWRLCGARKGRLRSYLLVSLKRFVASEEHRASGVKRYESGPHLPLEELRESDLADFERTESFSADRLYERRWALAVLEQVLMRLESEYQAAGNAALFERLKEFLVGERGRPTQAAIATELGMTENAVKQAFHRLRQRYRVLLREEIAHTVAQPGDVEGELRHLVSVLRG